MDGFTVELNGILVSAYHNILRLEENAVKKNSKVPLSISEMHLIECVGKMQGIGRTISELANDLVITRPSATVAVNKLEKKGYVQKASCENDGRVVRVYLTHEGEKIDSYHRFYHKNLIKEISHNLTDEEKNCLLKAIRKLNEYFNKSIGENE
jgi:DNA-binding MarR family transcriptional regulator